MSTKLVICGYGWLGRHIGQAMSTTHHIVATTRTQSKLELLAQQNINGLLFSLGEDTTALCRELPGAILILNIPPGRKNTQFHRYTHHMLTLINDAVRAGVQRIIFISTTSVYGEKYNGKVFEDSPLAPETESAKAHVQIEKHLIDNVDSAYIVRLSGLTGPNRHPITSLSGRTLSAGNKRVNLVHSDDVVAAINVMVNTLPSHRIYHLSASTHPKRGHYYPSAATKRGLPMPLFSDTELPATGKCVIADNSWAWLGITPKYSNVDDM